MYVYRVSYYRRAARLPVGTVEVVAASADDAREQARRRDPEYLSTDRSPRRLRRVCARTDAHPIAECANFPEVS